MSSARKDRPTYMSLPKVVSRTEWLDARKELLTKEKELTRTRDALSAERRRLPMCTIEKDYVLDGRQGLFRLSDLFGGRRHCIVLRFMFHAEWEEGCRS